MRTVSWLSVLVVTILLGCTAWSTGHGQDRPATTTWEYKVVRLTDDSKHVEASFNNLSQQGWEFVGAIHLRPESPNDAVFKRPRK
jgi:hypothetical protein